MRISIRRCLSMLRKTSDGNELAVPAPNACKEHSVGNWYTASREVLVLFGILLLVLLEC